MKTGMSPQGHTAGLTELAGRCEKLTGPCRETDARIWYEVNRQTFRKLGSVDEYLATSASRSRSVPDYTRSADTALRLVPVGYYVELRRYSDGWYCWIAEHSKFRDATPWIGSQKKAPELAIIPPALRARAALESSHG